MKFIDEVKVLRIQSLPQSQYEFFQGTLHTQTLTDPVVGFWYRKRACAQGKKKVKSESEVESQSKLGLKANEVLG